MSKFNKSSKGNSVTENTVSKDGVPAFKQTAYTELCDRVLTSFFGEDKFYESGKESSDKLVTLIRTVGEVDPVFVAKLAVLAREKFNLRSVTQVIVAELSKIHKHDSLVASLVGRVATRPDDLTELVAYLIKDAKSETDLKTGNSRLVNKKIPHSIKKGIGNAITKFSEYHWDKYSGVGKDVKLTDLLSIAHPKPLDAEQGAMWKRAIEGKLAPADTWEQKLSATGGDRNAKTEAWEALIRERKLGYMAALRNIRNVMEAGVSDEVHALLQNYISNENAVATSKQLPFRFFSAFKELSKLTSTVNPFIRKGYYNALSTAISYSAKNITQLKGRSVVAVDCSGSMATALSAKSTVTYHEVGALMGALAHQFCENSIVCAFGSEFKLVDLLDEASATLQNVDKIINTRVGHSTDAHLIMKYLISNKISVDNILLFTDCQLNGQYGMNGGLSFAADISIYRKSINANVRIYEMDLAGHGTTQVNPRDPNYIHMSGWSDNTLKYITDYQDLKLGIVDMVSAVELD